MHKNSSAFSMPAQYSLNRILAESKKREVKKREIQALIANHNGRSVTPIISLCDLVP